MRVRTLLALGVLGCVGAAALLAPLLLPHDPGAVDLGRRLLGPSLDHPLGTDAQGRDLAARLVQGARLSLGVGVASVALALTVGTALGAVAGWVGGAVDRVLSWVIDLLLSLPRLVLALALMGLLRPHGEQAVQVLVGVLGLTGWMGVARLVRSEVRAGAARPYVEAARLLGFSDVRILGLHLVPAALSPAIVHATLAIGSTMVAEASLSFLGLGVPAPIASWGGMVADGRLRLTTAPMLTLAPAGMLVITTLSFHALGDALRERLDPRYRPPTR